MSSECEENGKVEYKLWIFRQQRKFENIKQECNVRPKRPIKPFAPRSLPLIEKKKVQEIINKYLKLGIIRTSESECASPIVMVRIKLGVLRMYVDFYSLTHTQTRAWKLKPRVATSTQAAARTENVNLNKLWYWICSYCIQLMYTEAERYDINFDINLICL